MIRRRASLAMLMGLVAVLAVSLAAMKVADEWLARGVILVVFGGLLFATLGAFVRHRDRAAWIGVAVFGWGHVLISSGVPFLTDLDSSNRDFVSDFEIWRPDEAIRILAARLHPLPPSPQDNDPFPETKINRDPLTGRRTKIINGQDVPLTPEELKLQVEYEAQYELYMKRTRAGRHARAIGLALQGLAFALVGGAAGHALSDEHAHGSGSSGSDASTLPG